MNAAAWRQLRVPLALALTGWLAAAAWAQPVQARDDGGATIALAQPARRIVSLAPHATELLFAAGAGRQLVGVSRYSDFPPAARAIAQVGDSARLDFEALAAMHPDLVVAWGSALPPRSLATLHDMGLPVFRSEPHTLDAIADDVEALATLAGTSRSGHVAARDLRARIEALRQRHRGLAPLPVFVQVWPEPLMTINRDQAISDALASCGAVNLFASALLQVVTVDPEAVSAADPAVIVSGVTADGSESAAVAFRRWRALPGLQAVAGHHLVALDADLLSRPGPRLIDATEQLCQAFDRVRAGLPLAEPAASKH